MDMAKIQAIVDEAKSNYDKFADGKVKAAGTRLRKNMSELAKAAKEVRAQVLAAREKAAE